VGPGYVAVTHPCRDDSATADVCCPVLTLLAPSVLLAISFDIRSDGELASNDFHLILGHDVADMFSSPASYGSLDAYVLASYALSNPGTLFLTSLAGHLIARRTFSPAVYVERCVCELVWR
jgi:hypothetical protein